VGIFGSENMAVSTGLKGARIGGARYYMNACVKSSRKVARVRGDRSGEGAG
jgi:hypothetical protein